MHCYNDCDADTPLTLACRKGYDNIVRILLDSGANPWMMSSEHSSVEAAIESGQVSTIELLLNRDNDLLKAKCPRIGGTPLLAAIRKQQFEIVHFLLDLGANALETTKNGSTTLL